MYGSNMQKTYTSVGVHTFRVSAGSSGQSSSNAGGSGGSGGTTSSCSSGYTGAVVTSTNDNDGADHDDAWLEAHNVRREVSCAVGQELRPSHVVANASYRSQTVGQSTPRQMKYLHDTAQIGSQ